ncbi:hypothetical protein BT96DRAFT_944528 [Gymnopus androsaceus JB14]|uniref:Uncharacterized protein n=1 Tax=Gymnopus androsaceus JB14 TaxID=1447944 RepID=A0A6A4H319_9AGAR|nr:hypothetical protein BT96DRAFT_944528 [Gymnopus androsaceus JB14]
MYPPQFPFAPHPPQFPSLPLNSGYSNQRFQTQTQGSNPSSFVFGFNPAFSWIEPNLQLDTIQRQWLRWSTTSPLSELPQATRRLLSTICSGIIPAGGDVASLTQRIGKLSAELASKQLG